MNDDFVFCMGDESEAESAANQDGADEEVARQKKHIESMKDQLEKNFAVPNTLGVMPAIEGTLTGPYWSPLIQTPAQAQEQAENALQTAMLKKESLPLPAGYDMTFTGNVTSLKIGDVDLGGGWTIQPDQFLKLSSLD